jgi:hypothetical protein
LFGVTPWKGINEADLLNNILTKKYIINSNSIKITKFSLDLIEKLLKLNENERYSWDELF